MRNFDFDLAKEGDVVVEPAMQMRIVKIDRSGPNGGMVTVQRITKDGRLYEHPFNVMQDYAEDHWIKDE